MSLGQTIEQRIDALLLGTYTPSATHSMESGRFSRMDDSVPDVLSMPDYKKERCFNVNLQGGKPMIPTNPINPTNLFVFELTVDIGYLVTNSGDDSTEGTNPLNGAATNTAVITRMTTDNIDIQRVLTWYENFAGLTPDVCNIKFTGSNRAITATSAKLTLSFDLICDVSSIVSYAAI